MGSLSEFGRMIERRARLRGYRAIKAELDNLSDADLQDMGVRRFQLGHVARARALK